MVKLADKSRVQVVSNKPPHKMRLSKGHSVNQSSSTSRCAGWQGDAEESSCVEHGKVPVLRKDGTPFNKSAVSCAVLANVVVQYGHNLLLRLTKRQQVLGAPFYLDTAKGLHNFGRQRRC